MKNLWKCKCGYQSWEDGFNKENLKIIKVRCPYCGKKMYKDLESIEKFSVSSKTHINNPQSTKRRIIQ